MSSATDAKTIARTGEPVRAVVCAGGEETPYLRAGRGDALILLMDEYDGRLALELVALLSARFLVIAPRLPQMKGKEPLGAWLANVMEGLGMVRASVLTQTGFVTDSARFLDAQYSSSRLLDAVFATPPAGKCASDES